MIKLDHWFPYVAIGELLILAYCTAQGNNEADEATKAHEAYERPIPNFDISSGIESRLF